MSDTIYIEYKFTVMPLQPASDILIAELGEVGFESFVETEEGILAYIQRPDWHEDILERVLVLSNDMFEIRFEMIEIAQQNWNATWESNFEPILIGDKCLVRAPFHEAQKVDYDIVIMPKMSFGTGHHETTHMMLQHILDHDMTGKTVLDMGSGTGVLAILAAMKGAKAVDAIDIDHWCFLNAEENVTRNSSEVVTVLEGDVNLLKDQRYDMIFANINRNILLSDIPTYVCCLNPKGLLFLSGFYEADIPAIQELCNANNLEMKTTLKKGDWVSLKFQEESSS